MRGGSRRRRAGSGTLAIVVLLSLVLVPAAPAQPHAAWAAAGVMTIERTAHTATLLESGLVLVAGGVTFVPADPPEPAKTPTTPTAELYDPTSNTWTATDDMAVPRHWFTATRLADGRVLAAGGYTGPSGTRTKTAEVWDPTTGQWSFTGDMTAPRSSHTATLLTDGRVLVAGGTLDASMPSAEIYDPATGTWAATGNLQCDRFEHAAQVLPSGHVLAAAGGEWGCSPAGSALQAERFDPATATWSGAGTLPVYSTPPRSPASALLADGTVLVAGGATCCAVYRTTSIYSPTSNSWTQVGDMGTPRWVFQATRLLDGKVLVEGGHIGAPTQSATASAELYDPASQSWAPTNPMSVARHGHTATLLDDGSVLVAGGYDNSSNYWATAERYFSPTAVMVRRVTATRRAKGVVVRWSTAFESQLLGFDVYRQRHGKLVKLTRKLVPSVFAGTRTGHAYSWTDRTPGKARATYRLQAVTIDGARSWVGAATA